MLPEDEQFMSRALELAEKGRGSVEPNPMVGALLVRDGRVLGSGWHKHFGGPHGEIEAINNARANNIATRGATLYVTLEPCCHHGKTPPCVEAILEAGISRVVVAMEDPNSKVRGGGIAFLRQRGLEVVVGPCEARARRLLAAYVKVCTTHRPWVICKWAQTQQGLLALPPGHGRWISSPESRQYVQGIRARCDGLCVGVDTLLADDPLLTNRTGEGGRPARLILDAKLRIPQGGRLIKSIDLAPVIVATTAAALAIRADRAEELRQAGVELLVLPPAENRGVCLSTLLDELGRRSWTHLVVEGGAGVLESFVLGGLADELFVFVCPSPVVAVRPNLPRFDLAEVSSAMSLGPGRQKQFGPDMLHHILMSEDRAESPPDQGTSH